LGSAEVVHPFHPLRGKRFDVLKIRRVAGIERLSLRDPILGSFAVPREWTDWASPDERACASGLSLVVDAFGLVALAELTASLRVATSELTDESTSDSIGRISDSVRQSR
jgi:hypothetical protein